MQSMWAISLTFSPPVWHLWLAQENRVGGADGDGGEEMREKTAGNGVVGGDGKQQAGAGMGSHTPGKAFLQEAENYFLFLHAMAGVGGNHPDQDSYCPPRLGQV